MPTFQNFGVEYQRSQTKNQSEIRLLKKVGAPIHIQACFRAGSRYNTISGVAHFLEHMLVSGTALYPSKLALAQALEEVGGSFGALTNADLLKVNILVPETKEVPFAIGVLKEMLTASNFTEEIFNNEKSVVLREQQDSGQDPARQMFDAVWARFYSDAELRFKTLGTAESISNLKLEEVKQFYTDNITNDKVVFIVSGDVEMSVLETELSKINLSEKIGAKLPAILPVPTGEKIVAVKAEGKNTDIFFVTRADFSSLEELAGLFLIRQFFMGRGSVFMNRLRYEKGLVYGGGVPFVEYNQTSIFGFRTTCAKDKLKTVLEIICDILEERRASGFSEAELAILKIKTNSFYRFNRQTALEWLEAEVQAVQHFADETKDSDANALTLLSLVLEMTPETLTKIYRKFINLEQMCVVVRGEVSEEDLVEWQTVFG